DADDFSLQLATLQLSHCDDKIRNQVPGPELISITKRRFARSKPVDPLHAVPDAQAGDLGSDDVKLAVGRGVQTGGARVSLSLIFERTDLNRHLASVRAACGMRIPGSRGNRTASRPANAFRFWYRWHKHLLIFRPGIL